MGGVAIQPPDDFSGASEWASAYRALGLAVIPAGPEKRPYGKWKEFTQNGIPQAAHDRWYGPGGDNVGNMRMGFLTGAASIRNGHKLLVIDLDLKPHVSGMETWDRWIGEHEMGCMPETWTARTGGGGTHIYFWYPDTLTIGGTQLTFPGVDVRADGGFIMAPPSLHTSGKLYVWEQSPFETELAEAPQWLLDIVGAAKGHYSDPAPRERHEAAGTTDAWGNTVDGRDAKMRGIVWRVVVDMYRGCPIPPSADASEGAMLAAYESYANRTRPQNPANTLEDEGRGLTAFRAKWAYAMGQWDTKVAAAAAVPVQGHVSDSGNPDIDWSSKPQPAAADIASELEWFDEIKPITAAPYVIKSVLDQGAMSVVYGASNSGKTFFALDLAFHVATSSPWRDLRVAGGSVLYLAAEGGNGIANRIVGLRQSTGVLDVPMALRRAGLDLLRPDADTARVIALAEEVAKRAPLKLIVIDTLSRVLAGGDENGPVDMTAFIKNVDRIRGATGAHVMIVHHTGKDTARGARGHSSLRAATDTEIEVTEDEETGERTAKATKQREYAGGEEWRFELEAMELGKDQDGDAVTTCTVRALTGQPVEDDKLPPMTVCRQMLNAIHEAWVSGNPFTVAGNMKSSGRYASRVLSSQFRVEAAKVERLLIGWIDSATVSIEMVDTTSRKRGLKVLQWLE